MMPLDALKLISDAEESARSMKAAAAAKAKQMLSDAEKEGEALLVSTKEKAEAELESKRIVAKNQNDTATSNRKALLEKQKSELRSIAEGRLDAAASVIVERIVNG